jgi:hypothetical protein
MDGPDGIFEEDENWLNESIILVEHQRNPIPYYVKVTVDAYGDKYLGTLGYKTVYNHYVSLRASNNPFLCCPTVDTDVIGSIQPNIQFSDRNDGTPHPRRHYRLA